MTADVIIDSPDAELLPDPETTMFEFYEGLDTNLFSESTGINHNASPKWLKAELARHLDFLSYLLSVKSNKAIMSDAIVHTNALLDNSVTANKLSPELRGILESGDLYNVIERNSVQTLNCLSATGTDSILHVAAGTVVSQANGFGTLGQVDNVEIISVAGSIVQTLGETLTGYLYKVVGGAYVQSTTPLATLGSNMVGTRVLLGTFKVSASPDNFVYDVVSSTPLATFRDVAITGSIVSPFLDGKFALKVSQDSPTGAAVIPAGSTLQRPVAPQNGLLRYNNDTNSMEGYVNGAWGSIGGGATGGGQDAAFFENDAFISQNYTIGQAAMLACTISISSPAVIVQNNNFVAGQPIKFVTTGALPTGLDVDTVYYVAPTSLSATSFKISATDGGVLINSTGTQSGTHACGKIKNAVSAGDITIGSGVDVTIGSGSTWTIL